MDEQITISEIGRSTKNRGRSLWPRLLIVLLIAAGALAAYFYQRQVAQDATIRTEIFALEEERQKTMRGLWTQDKWLNVLRIDEKIAEKKRRIGLNPGPTQKYRRPIDLPGR